jgi:hypothetical protein
LSPSTNSTRRRSCRTRHLPRPKRSGGIVDLSPLGESSAVDHVSCRPSFPQPSLLVPPPIRREAIR